MREEKRSEIETSERCVATVSELLLNARRGEGDGV